MEQFLQQLMNGLMAGSTYAVVALGFGLTFSVMHVLNLAHPETAMLGAFGGYVVMSSFTNNILVVAAAAVVTGLLAGLIIERLAIRPTRGRHILTSFIATGGVSMVMQNGTQRIFGVDPVRMVGPISGVQNFGGVIASNMQLLTFGIAAAMMLALRFYVQNTKWGRATRAVSEKHEVAAALGVDINRVSQLTVGISTAVAGMAGISIALLQSSANPYMGAVFGTKSFVCMLVAGNRRIEGIALVGLLLGVLEALVAGYISSSLRDMVAFAVLVAVLYFRPAGLFGSYEH